MSDNLPDDLRERVERDEKFYMSGEDGLHTILTEWAHDLQAAKECAHDGGGVCPMCGSYCKRAADKHSQNALWECTQCHERYYTNTDSIAASYYYMEKKVSELLGFKHGAFPKQLYEWIESHKEKQS